MCRRTTTGSDSVTRELTALHRRRATWHLGEKDDRLQPALASVDLIPTRSVAMAHRPRASRRSAHRQKPRPTGVPSALYDHAPPERQGELGAAHERLVDDT